MCYPGMHIFYSMILSTTSATVIHDYVNGWLWSVEEARHTFVKLLPSFSVYSELAPIELQIQKQTVLAILHIIHLLQQMMFSCHSWIDHISSSASRPNTLLLLSPIPPPHVIFQQPIQYCLLVIVLHFIFHSIYQPYHSRILHASLSENIWHALPLLMYQSSFRVL